MFCLFLHICDVPIRYLQSVTTLLFGSRAVCNIIFWAIYRQIHWRSSTERLFPLLQCIGNGMHPSGTGSRWVSKRLCLWWHWAGQKGRQNEESSSCVGSGRQELLKCLKLGMQVALACVFCPVSVTFLFLHTCCHLWISAYSHLFYFLPVDKNSTIPQSLLPVQGGKSQWLRWDIDR